MDVTQYLHALRHYVEERGFAGYDPYDALNSPLIRALSFGTKYGRIAWTQLMRRSPVNLRPILGAPRQQNPKGMGLFLGGYARLAAMGDSTASDAIAPLLESLSVLSSKGYSGNCWGYNFDWQSRAAFVPKGTPTIVNTSFVGHALLDAHEHCGSAEALEMASTIGDFMLRDLNRKHEGDAFCFSYTPIDENYVHNANMLGASLLIRLARIIDRPALRDDGLASLAYSMEHQRDDGSWPYAETHFQQWIDSFHTGFNLEALRTVLSLGEAEQYRDAYVQGRAFYVDNFFLPDGTPKYYHDTTFPIDIHAPAQAIAFFSREPREAFGELTDRILEWMLENLHDPRGFFYFRKHPHLTIRIPYMRWGQAWAFHALTRYAYETAS